LITVRPAADRTAAAGIIQWQRIAQTELSQTTRTVLAINAATGGLAHPTWRRRIAAISRPIKGHHPNA